MGVSQVSEGSRCIPGRRKGMGQSMKECVRTGSCWVIFENTAKGEAGGEMGEPRRASAVEDLEHLARERVWLYPVGGRD